MMIKMKSKALQSLFKSELWHPSEGILNQDGMDSDDDKMMSLMTKLHWYKLDVMGKGNL